MDKVIDVNPESVAKNYPYKNIKYIDISSVGTGILHKMKEFHLNKAPKRAKRIIRNGDILLATVRPNLRSFWYARDVPCNTIASTGFAILRSKENINSRYIYYVISNQAFTDYLTANVKGSAYPAVDINTIKRAEIYLPPYEIQNKIVNILSAFDDLIENNRKRIKILEEMAQNLYREWFVKFRFPGHENVRFVDSPLGKIPEGWGIASLNELIDNHIGGGWGKESPYDKYTEPAWIIRGTDIPKTRVGDLRNLPYRYLKKTHLSSRILKPGNIVFEVSGGSKGQPLGRSLIVTKELLSSNKNNNMICASFCKRIEVNSTKYKPELLYLSFLEAYKSGEIEQYQVQSTGISNFKWSDYLENVLRCVPPLTLQIKFVKMVSSILCEVHKLGRKNMNLMSTRDLLLPKLVSGELDVSELDIEVPEKD